MFSGIYVSWHISQSSVSWLDCNSLTHLHSTRGADLEFNQRLRRGERKQENQQSQISMKTPSHASSTKQSQCWKNKMIERKRFPPKGAKSAIESGQLEWKCVRCHSWMWLLGFYLGFCRRTLRCRSLKSQLLLCLNVWAVLSDGAGTLLLPEVPPVFGWKSSIDNRLAKPIWRQLVLVLSQSLF